MKYPLTINFRTEILPILIIALSLVLGMYFYQQFPEQIISHWDFSGNPNGYSGKFLGAFGLPFMLLGFYFLFLLLPLIDPHKERYQEFQKAYHIFRGALFLLLFAIFLIMGLANIGYPVAIQQYAPIFMGIFMMVMGNFMAKIKNNWFMGIRTPWTLSSENVWNKTHRLGGWLFVLYGILLMATPFFGPLLSIWITVLGIFSIIIVTLVYSYLLYKKEQLK